jgi:hypothetical protein
VGTPSYRNSLDSTWVHQVTGTHWRVRGYTKLQELTGEYVGTPSYRNSPESTWVHQVIRNHQTELHHVSDKYDDAINRQLLRFHVKYPHCDRLD